LIIPGFADTAVGPHNFHVQIARKLQQLGCAVLRFDYRGQGESEGDFIDFTIASGFADVEHAWQRLCQFPFIDQARMGVVGYSLGGLYAVELAAKQPSIRGVGLLAPVAHPERVFRSFFTDEQLLEADRQGWIDWLGWPVGAPFIQGLSTIQPLPSMRTLHAPVHIFHGTYDREVPPDQAIAYEQAGAKISWIEAGDHGFTSVAQNQRIIEQLSTWLAQQVST
jgi:pimeloyl-ACP methyl ester carboxylesterase